MVIAIFRSLGGENLEDYSIRLAQQWRIGQKGLDNGVILLVFLQERKMRLEVGYGLEPVIPDAAAGQIIGEVIAPRFRERRYAAGLEGAANAVFEHVAAAKATPIRRQYQVRVPPWVGIPLVVLIFIAMVGVVIVLPAVLWVRLARRLGYTLGGEGWSTSRGSYSGGGSFSSSGSSSSGFSGGGGSFGGGGASGGW